MRKQILLFLFVLLCAPLAGANVSAQAGEPRVGQPRIFDSWANALQKKAVRAPEQRSLTSGGVQRTYLLYKPDPKADVSRLPVIIMLHGGGGSSKNANMMTGLAKKAVPRGFMVVYPDGLGRTAQSGTPQTWNAGHCCGYAMKQKVDDVGFISALIDSLVANDQADPKRIYVTGLSNGGMMAHRIGRELSGKVAAIAPVIAGLFGDEPPPAGPVPALIINGALDKTIPVDGGETAGRSAKAWDVTTLMPAAYQGEYWAKANDCREATQSQTQTLSIWRYACPAGREVVRYLVMDSGHSWPGGHRGTPRADAPSTTLDASDLIIAFFEKH